MLVGSEHDKKDCSNLKNRRKSQFGPLDGNPLSLKQFQSLDSTISQEEIDDLIELGILKKVEYKYEILDFNDSDLTDEELVLLNLTSSNFIEVGKLKTERSLKVKRISITKTIDSLIEKNIVKCTEERYEFKNTKISSGLKGVNRVFMPSSDIFPTLVASDTNDYISIKNIVPTTHQEYKENFLKEVYFANQYRKITKEEACLIQGFPKDFLLPESRARWMKLIGNSVSVPVIDVLIKAIISTGVFEQGINGKGKNNKQENTTMYVQQ